MDDYEYLVQSSNDIKDLILHSEEYKKLESIITIMNSDSMIINLKKKLDYLQSECRKSENDLAKKKIILQEIEKAKAELHSFPVWTNYVSAREEVERLKEEVVFELGGKIG